MNLKSIRPGVSRVGVCSTCGARVEVPLTSIGPIYDYLKFMVRDQLRSEICKTLLSSAAFDNAKLLIATE